MEEFLEFRGQTAKTKKDHYLWTEKYRPDDMADFVGNDSLKESVNRYIEEKDIGHLLFFGPAGTGKTSLAKLLSKKIDCDCLYINASDERGIDTIRYKITGFASSAGFHDLKIIILDEADALTGPGQAALRNTMETHSSHTRFILTCNYHEKIISPITSRCQIYEVKPLSKKDVAIQLAKILTKESVSYTKEDLAFIVNKYHPDLRRIINVAQQSTHNGKLKLTNEDLVESDLMTKIVEGLKTPSKKGLFNEFRQLVADADALSFDDIYKYLFEKVSDYAPGKEAVVCLELADGVYQSSLVFEKQIVFVATLYKIINALK
jgi:DNA polymerase III delta prime subunit